MSSFAVRSLVVSSTTASTSTSTGAIICAGGMGISGNVTVGGNVVTGGTITGNTLLTSSTLTLTDGLNTGIISQLGSELTLSSSGNKIALAANHSLVFKNDTTTQLTGYTAREIVDDCDTHSYMYNTANPSTPKYMLSSTFALNQGAPTTFSVANTTTTYAYPVRLIKGQVVTGAGFYVSVTSGAPQVGYALYDSANPSNRVANTTSNLNTVTTGINYFAYSATYTVPTTGIYYTCIYAGSLGGGLSLIAMPSNIYLNYGLSTMTSGVFNKAAQSAATGSAPATMTGIAMTLLDRVAYSVVYTG